MPRFSSCRIGTGVTIATPGAHLRHNRRRTKYSDALSGGARSRGRFYFEKGEEGGEVMKGRKWNIQAALPVQLLMALVLVFVLPGVSAAVEVGKKAPAGGTGTITGVVKFAGTPPPLKEIPPTKDKRVCGKAPIYDQSLVVDEGTKGIQWAVVSVQGAKGKWNGKGATLDQKGCMFRPHVLVTPPGKITVLNSDRILHNFHSYSKANPALNRVQPGFKKKMQVEFKKPEIIKVTCDPHSWMKAWIVVAEHPYYTVTDGTGAFVLTDVPAGSYQLRVWHETLGEEAKDVVVNAGAEANVTFELMKK